MHSSHWRGGEFEGRNVYINYLEFFCLFSPNYLVIQLFASLWLTDIYLVLSGISQFYVLFFLADLFPSNGHWGHSCLAPVSLWIIFISVCEGRGPLREWPSPEFYTLHHPHVNTPTGKSKEIHLTSQNFIWSGFQKVWGESGIISVFWYEGEDRSLLMRSKNPWFQINRSLGLLVLVSDE